MDASSLFHFIRAINRMLKSSDDTRFDDLLYVLKIFLTAISICSIDGKIHIPRKVYSQQIDPLNSNSSLRRMSELQYITKNRKRNFRELSRLFENFFSSSSDPASEKDLEVIKRLIRGKVYEMPADTDLSLIVLSLRLGEDRGAVLVTDDTGLQQAVDVLTRNRVIELTSGKYDTNKTLAFSSLSYLEDPYICCKFLPQDFIALFDSIVEHASMLYDTFSELSYSHYERLIRHVSSVIMSIPK